MSEIHATTILSVRGSDKLVLVGDGQVSVGDTVLKSSAKKVRRLGAESAVLAGFAGATADAMALFERLEIQLERYPKNLQRAAIALAKEWRTDRFLRHLDAMLLVADRQYSFIITGRGDVLQPDDRVAAIGSGGNYAMAAALALYPHQPDTEKLARTAMEIAARICIYTNDELVIETLETQ